MKVVLVLFALALPSLRMAGERIGSLVQQAPRKFSQVRNPYEGDRVAARAGRKLFERECAACHGKDAHGSGKVPPLILPHVYRAAPGALFWVLRNGSLKRGMPSYAHLPEQQRWQIISYLKSLR
ncbi:MAG: c-type cytochrome [Bryobacteraceae bacterium]